MGGGTRNFFLLTLQNLKNIGKTHAHPAAPAPWSLIIHWLLNQLTKTHKITIHFVCLEEKKWLVLFVTSFEPVDETNKMTIHFVLSWRVLELVLSILTFEPVWQKSIKWPFISLFVLKCRMVGVVCSSLLTSGWNPWNYIHYICLKERKSRSGSIYFSIRAPRLKTF